MFDYKVMSRCGIPLSALPEGSTVINKPFSLLDEYRPQMFAIIGFFIVLCGFVIHLLLEIRKRKRKEETLRWKTALLEAQVNTSIDGILVVDENNRRIITNRRLIDLWNIPQHILDDEDDTALLTYVTGLIRWPDKFIENVMYLYDHPSEISRDEIEFKSGMVMDRYSAPVLGMDGHHYGRIWMFRDITERRQMEDALRLSEEKYRIVADNTYDWEFWRNPEGRFIYISPACLRITGYNPEDFMRDQDYLFHIIHPEDRVGYELHEREADGQRQAGELEFRIVCKNGNIRWIGHACMPVYGLNEQFLGTRGSNRDITDRILMEEKRLVMSKLESTGILAGGIAHDFNNLLAAMVENLEMARMLAVPRGEIDEHLAAAEKAVWDARSLTQELITLAKGGAPVRKTISLSELLEEQVAFTLRGSSVISEMSLPSDLWRVEADSGQIGQVIRNLVLNAREAMPAGGMVRVTAENQVFKGETGISLPDGNFVTVSIADQGGGIAEEILPKIFDPYFSTKQRGEQKGMGLGLTICQSIILKHGGMISVSSKAGIGTTFSIDLPASDKLVQIEKRKAPAVQSDGGRILLMDDEEGLRKLYAAALKKSGYDVSLADNGEAATDLYKEAMAQGRPFDAVILDLTVRGGIGGLDAMKSLLAVDPDVRAVISSGYADDPAMMDHERYGFKGALAKPFGIAELREVLSRVRKQREMTHE
jgi:PAS domain S-box-containing protein